MPPYRNFHNFASTQNLAGFIPFSDSDNIAFIVILISARGICDRTLGHCHCMPEFNGAACERLECPGGGNCNGHGRCMSLESFAEHSRYRRHAILLKLNYSTVYTLKFSSI